MDNGPDTAKSGFIEVGRSFRDKRGYSSYRDDDRRSPPVVHGKPRPHGSHGGNSLEPGYGSAHNVGTALHQRLLYLRNRIAKISAMYIAGAPPAATSLSDC